MCSFLHCPCILAKYVVLPSLLLTTLETLTEAILHLFPLWQVRSTTLSSPVLGDHPVNIDMTTAYATVETTLPLDNVGAILTALISTTRYQKPPQESGTRAMSRPHSVLLTSSELQFAHGARLCAGSSFATYICRNAGACERRAVSSPETPLLRSFPVGWSMAFFEIASGNDNLR